jgi:hypothetical protein
VKPFGNRKIVSIESPLVFANNTEFPLDFFLTKEDELKSKLINHVK